MNINDLPMCQPLPAALSVQASFKRAIYTWSLLRFALYTHTPECARSLYTKYTFRVARASLRPMHVYIAITAPTIHRATELQIRSSFQSVLVMYVPSLWTLKIAISAAVMGMGFFVLLLSGSSLDPPLLRTPEINVEEFFMKQANVTRR